MNIQENKRLTAGIGAGILTGVLGLGAIFTGGVKPPIPDKPVAAGSPKHEFDRFLMPRDCLAPWGYFFEDVETLTQLLNDIKNITNQTSDLEKENSELQPAVDELTEKAESNAGEIDEKTKKLEELIAKVDMYENQKK